MMKVLKALWQFTFGSWFMVHDWWDGGTVGQGGPWPTANSNMDE